MNPSGNILDQLSDFQSWKAHKADFDLIDYLMCVGTADFMVAAMALISPELLEHQGNLFIKHNFSESVYEAWAERTPDPREIQRVMNHFHVSSFLQDQAISNEVAVTIATQLASIWRRQFEGLGLTAEAYGDDLETAQVTLFRHP